MSEPKPEPTIGHAEARPTFTVIRGFGGSDGLEQLGLALIVLGAALIILGWEMMRRGR